MERPKKGLTKTGITILLMVLLSTGIICTYYYIQTSTTPVFSAMKKQKSELEILMEKDVNNSYPASPKEVLRLYHRFLKCLYDESLDDEKLKEMVQQMRLLYDEELIDANSVEEQVETIKKDIQIFKKANRQFTNYLLENNNSTIYWNQDGMDYASMAVAYSVNESGSIFKAFEEFILRKDKDERWKILGWELSNKESIDTKE